MMNILTLIAIGCHFGRPPVKQGYYVQHVEISGHEFAFNRMIEGSVLRALASNRAIGDKPLKLKCLMAQENLVAVNNAGQIWELIVEMQVMLSTGQMMSVKDKERFIFQPPNTITFAEERHKAYQNVSDRIADSLVKWVLFSQKEPR